MAWLARANAPVCRCALLGLLFLPAAACSGWVLNVMTEEGQAVPAAEACLLTRDGGLNSSGCMWVEGDASGIIQLEKASGVAPSGARRSAVAQALVVAPDHAGAVVALHGERESVDVVLEKGMDAQVVLAPADGKSLPDDCSPVLVSKPLLKPAWASMTGCPGRPVALARGRALGGGRYTFRVPENPPPLYLLLDAPGHLRQFQAGPFLRTQLGGNALQLQLPSPCTLEAELAGGGVLEVRRAPEGRQFPGDTSPVLVSSSDESTIVRFLDLAPGEYRVRYAPAGNIGQADERDVKLTDAKTARITLGRGGEAAGHLPRFPVLHLVGANGGPVAGAEVTVRRKGVAEPAGPWRPARDGIVRFEHVAEFAPFGSGSSIDGEYEVLARAPDHTWTSARVMVTTASAEADEAPSETIRLELGRPVDLVLRRSGTRPLPQKLVPAVFTADWGDAVWSSAQHVERPFSSATTASLFTMIVPEPLGEGRFRIQVPDPSVCENAPPGLRLFVNEPGFLRGWQSELLDVPELGRTGKAELLLPDPAELTLRFEPPPGGFEEGKTSYTACGVRIARLIPEEVTTRPATRTCQLAGGDTDSTRLTTTVADLAPGEYQIDFGTGERRDPESALWTGDYRMTTRTVLAAGGKDEVTATYETFDPGCIGANFTAVVRVFDAKGKPAVGRSYELEGISGLTRRTEKGTLPEDGIVEIAKLHGFNRPVDASLLRKHEIMTPEYTFSVDGKRAGRVVFYAGGETLIPDAEPGGRKSFEFRLPAGPGDAAPDVELVDLSSSRTIRLSDLRGQVVFVDFWASWCGACQQPMQKNQEIAARRSSEWAGRAVVLGASIDAEQDAATAHIQAKAWHAMRHAWCPPGGEQSAGGWGAPAPRAFGVSGVPSAFLLDSQGMIVWSGHPGNFDVETEIDRLLMIPNPQSASR